MKTSLAHDPSRALLTEVALRLTQSPKDGVSVDALTKQALHALELDPNRAPAALQQLGAWAASPQESAQQFLADLSLQTGLTLSSMTEDAALKNLAALGVSAKNLQAGLPSSVVAELPAAEKSSLWDGQHERLAHDFPTIVLGEAKAGSVSLQDLVPEGVDFKVTEDLKQRIAAGVNPREHLQPGGIVATELLAQMAGIEAGSKVVDLCSGEGGGAAYLAQTHGAEVIGYEVAQTAVAQAKDKIAERGLDGQVEIRAQSISRIDVPPNSLDAVTGMDADGIHYVDDRQSMFDRVHDGLKEGGAFVFKAYAPGIKPDHLSDKAWQAQKDKFDHGMGWDGEDASSTVRPTGMNAEGYVAQLVEAGFKRDDIEVVDLNPLYTAWQEAVGHNQGARGFEDGWLTGWLEQNNETHAMGFLIRAKKAEVF